MIATSIEQSKKLVKLGIDTSTADMCYREVAYNPDDNHVWQLYAFYYVIDYGDIPAWSLSALLELMPYEVVLDEDESLILGIHKEDSQYYFDYNNTYSGEIHIDTLMCDDPIDAAVEMIVWLKENKYI